MYIPNFNKRKYKIYVFVIYILYFDTACTYPVSFAVYFVHYNAVNQYQIQENSRENFFLPQNLIFWGFVLEIGFYCRICVIYFLKE